MIDFELTEELRLIQETAREFATQVLLPRDRDFEQARAIPDAIQRGFAETGLASLELPDALGGVEVGALARVLVLEELAAADPGATLALDPLGPALYVLRELGGGEALLEFGAPVVERPGARAIFAWDGEGRLRREAGRVRGLLPWVPADRVDCLVVLDPQGGFVITEGIETSVLRGAGLRGAGASEVRLEGAAVAAAWDDAEGASRALARARLYGAALLLGSMRASADFSRQYARERVAFGRPIAHHQALAFLIADMAAAIDGARLLAWDAAWRLDAGVDALEPCATAFAEAAEQAMFVGPNGVQILGGHGFMQDYPVEKYMRESRALGLWFGGIDRAREDAGLALADVGGPVALTAGER